jgi:hypothetical protein
LTQSAGVSFFGPTDEENEMRQRYVYVMIQASVYLLVGYGYVSALTSMSVA